MTSYSADLATTTDGTQAVIDIAQQAVAPVPLALGAVYAVRGPGGTTTKLDLTGEQYRDAPTRKTGTYTFRDAASFLAYWGKHSDEDSEIYADVEQLRITAVLDAHTPDGPRFGQHRAHLSLRHTPAWEQWIRQSGRLMDQEPFANFLEDHLPELVTPDAATMLEVAQSIQAATKGEFQSGTRLTSGERKFVYTETIAAKAGQKGELTIPEVFVIGVRPFEGADAWTLNARFRYRLNGGGLQLGYKLERADDVLREAFAAIVKQVDDQVTVPVLNGTPA